MFGTQLRRNMLSGVVTVGTGTLVVLLQYPIYLALLGYRRYGVWIMLSTIVGAAQIGDLGISQALMKLVAEEHERGAKGDAAAYLVSGLLLLSGVGILIVVALVALRHPIARLLNLPIGVEGEFLHLLPYAGLLSAGVLLGQALQGSVSGIGRMDLANYVQLAGRVVGLATGVVLLVLGWGVAALLAGATVALLFRAAWYLTVLHRRIDLNLASLRTAGGRRLKHLVRFGAGVFGGSVMNLLLSPFQKVLVSRYIGIATVPVYEIANRGAMQVRGLGEAAFQATMPEISALAANDPSDSGHRIRHLYRRSVALVFGAGAPLFAGVFVLAPELLKVWLGHRYVPSQTEAFRLMLAAAFASLLGVPAYYELLGSGRVRQCFVGHLVQAAMSVAAVGLFALSFGHLTLRLVLVSAIVGFAASTTYLLAERQRLAGARAGSARNPGVSGALEGGQ